MDAEKRRVDISRKTIEDVVKRQVENDKETEKKRNELIVLSRAGSINKSISVIKNAKKAAIEKMHDEYNEKRIARVNNALLGRVISGVSRVLKALDAVDDAKALEDELKEDELLMDDLLKGSSMIVPGVPCIGIMSGSATVLGHIYKHRNGLEVVEEVDEKDDVVSETGPKL